MKILHPVLRCMLLEVRGCMIIGIEEMCCVVCPVSEVQFQKSTSEWEVSIVMPIVSNTVFFHSSYRFATIIFRS